MSLGPPPKIHYCNFCGKSQHEVSQIVAGPSVDICNECIDLCIEIIYGPLPKREEEPNGERQEKV